MSARNPTLGLFCALGVVFIWAGFIVFSRAGVLTTLTAFDVTAFRFLVAGLITAPFVHAWWPRHLSIRATIILVMIGPGALYALLMYFGLNGASAAYAGVFGNGSLPVFTMLIVLVFSGVYPSRFQFGAILVIVLGAVMLSYPGLTGQGRDIAAGIGLFLAASALLSGYAYGVRYWALTPRQALVLVNIPSAIVFLPIWYVFLPSGMAEASLSMIVFQALYQGLGPGILGVVLFALATVHLGPTPTAGLLAAVPAAAALLAIPALGEVPNGLEWAGIATATAGLLLLIRSR